MTEPKSKPIWVLYDGDADGLTAAFCAWLKLGDQANYVAVERGTAPPPMPGAAAVFILDFSYPRDEMEKLAGTIPMVQLLDHHRTAEAELGDLPYCTFDMKQSGCGLAWNYFWPDEPMPAFIAYVQDADLWSWALPKSREIQAACDSWPLDFQTWQRISGISNPRDLGAEATAMEKLMADGEVCLRYASQQVAEIVEDARIAHFVMETNPQIVFDTAPMEDTGFKVPVVNTSVQCSEACNALLGKYPDAKFAAYYFDMGDGKRQWGLRSLGFDCSEIAKAFGGGGHAQAAGFQTEPEPEKETGQMDAVLEPSDRLMALHLKA